MVSSSSVQPRSSDSPAAKCRNEDQRLRVRNSESATKSQRLRVRRAISAQSSQRSSSQKFTSRNLTQKMQNKDFNSVSNSALDTSPRVLQALRVRGSDLRWSDLSRLESKTSGEESQKSRPQSVRASAA